MTTFMDRYLGQLGKQIHSSKPPRSWCFGTSVRLADIGDHVQSAASISFNVAKYLASVLFRVPARPATAHAARAVGLER